MECLVEAMLVMWNELVSSDGFSGVVMKSAQLASRGGNQKYPALSIKLASSSKPGPTLHRNAAIEPGKKRNSRVFKPNIFHRECLPIFGVFSEVEGPLSGWEHELYVEYSTALAVQTPGPAFLGFTR
jgi:hypothetical protein